MAGSRGERLTVDGYCLAALALLADDGSDGLTIAALCERLAVTKGSFYHHFADLADFERQLLLHWKTVHSDDVIVRLRTLADPVDRILHMIDLAVTLPHSTEAAIRAWARSSGAVADVVTRVDEERTAFVVDTLTALGLPPGRVRALAELGMDALVGRQMRAGFGDGEQLRDSFDTLRELTFQEAGIAFEQ